MDRHSEVRRLVHEYLTASMLMVSLDHPLPAGTLIVNARGYLEQRGYDLALLDTREVRIVYRDRLKDLAGEALTRPVKAYSSPPRMDRLIEHSLELGAVARRLAEDKVPLMVVGRDGPEFVITRSDFTRPAGQMAVLAVIAALDAYVDDLLGLYEQRALLLLTDEERHGVSKMVERAEKRSEEVRRLSYLTLGPRLRLVRDLGLAAELRIGTQAEHEKIVKVRNDIAHGRVPSGLDSIGALMLAERILDGIAERPASVEQAAG
jgi:hypothetical protein